MKDDSVYSSSGGDGGQGELRGKSVRPGPSDLQPASGHAERAGIAEERFIDVGTLFNYAVESVPAMAKDIGAFSSRSRQFQKEVRASTSAS